RPDLRTPWLFKEPHRGQSLEDEIGHVLVRPIHRVVNAALMAVALELAVVPFETLAVGASRRFVPADVELFAAFAVDQPERAAERRIELGAAQDLNRRDIQIEGAQEIEAFLVGSRR